VRLATDGVRALDDAHAFLPDLVVLDLGLPRLDGVEVAKQLRADSDDVPILMLTARDALESRVRASMRAPTTISSSRSSARSCSRACVRCCAAARRAARPRCASATCCSTPDTHEVIRGERAIELTQREFELLEYLMRNERIVISRQRLLDEVWGYDPFSTTNTIEVFVSNLRRKLEAEDEPRLLHTIRGAGYVLPRLARGARTPLSTGCRSACAWRASRRCSRS
jgi:two-component system response regulator MprA